MDTDTQAANDLTGAEAAAMAYCYETIRIGSTLEDFLKEYPNATCKHLDESNETGDYICAIDSNKMIGVSVLRGRVYSSLLTFDSHTITGIGGRSTLEAKVAGTFGAPHVKTEEFSYWVFPKVRRSISLFRMSPGNTTVFSVTDDFVHDQVKDMRIRNLTIGL